VQVGDLVRVYHFSHTARKHYKARAESESAHLFYVPDDIDGHYTGLIVENIAMPEIGEGNWRVLIPEWTGTEIYSDERIEVISEGR